MKLPTRNRSWLKEVKLAYLKAEKAHLKADGDLLEIYKLAPKFVAKNRGITSEGTINEMIEYSKADVAHGKRVDPGSERNYLFHFVASYIDGHHVAGLVDEMECDKIMEYVNYEWNLFPNA